MDVIFFGGSFDQEVLKVPDPPPVRIALVPPRSSPYLNLKPEEYRLEHWRDSERGVEIPVYVAAGMSLEEAKRIAVQKWGVGLNG